jgi:geranylgeranyl pyrophosphate synthase
MINILSILNFALTSLRAGDDRYKILDDEHILDTKTGVMFNMYDDVVDITRDDEVVLKLQYLTKDEQTVIWAIKQHITDPVKAKEKEMNYPAMVKEQRERFSDMYENPNPVASDFVEPEPDASEYAG